MDLKESDLARVAGIPSIAIVEIATPNPIPRGGIGRLGALPHLRRLTLGASLGASDLAAVFGLRSLEDLDCRMVRGDNIPVQVFGHLGDLAGLRLP